MITLGQRLGLYLERGRHKQAAVAAAWLASWKGRVENGPGWSPPTVEAHLRRLFSDDPQGARFFFHDRVRGALLLQVLQVPDWDQGPMFELAESVLRKEGAPARIVVDATGWPESVVFADQLFAELWRLLVAEGPYPIDIILLADQADQRPGDFEPLERERKLRLVRVKTLAQAWEAVQARTEEQGFVLSARRFPVFERWLAADFDGETLRVEPSEGVTWLRTRGALPTLEPVLHDLAELVPAGEENNAGLKVYSAREQHRWMRILRSEDESTRCKVDARTRQALALRLGITATSTPRERLDAQVRALQHDLGTTVEIRAAPPEELAATQERARRRRLEPTALQVGDAVYLLNVPGALPLAEWRPWVHVQDLEPEPTVLSRLLAEVDQWSEFDFLRDPFLEHLIQRLDPDERDRTAFLHARAGLLLNPAPRTRTPEPEAAWRPLLEQLLSHEPPAARLRVQLSDMLLEQEGDADGRERRRTSFLVARSHLERLAQLPITPLRHVPPLGDALVDREEPVLLCLGGAASRARFDDAARASLRIARGAAQARDPDSWLDAYELDMSPQPESLPLGDPRYLPPLKPWRLVPLHIAPGYWELADRELALAWLALRLALVNPRVIRQHGGALLLHLGGAFLAELRVVRLAEALAPAPLQACLLLEADPRRLQWNRPEEGCAMTDAAFGLSEFVTTHTFTSSTAAESLGARLPRRIHVLGERVCADIRFRGSALFGDALVPRSTPVPSDVPND